MFFFILSRHVSGLSGSQPRNKYLFRLHFTVSSKYADEDSLRFIPTCLPMRYKLTSKFHKPDLREFEEHVTYPNRHWCPVLESGIRTVLMCNCLVHVLIMFHSLTESYSGND